MANRTLNTRRPENDAASMKSAPLNTIYSVVEETFETITQYQRVFKWDCLFSLPVWMRTWWRIFGAGSDLFLRTVRRGDEILGVAPLRVRGDTARFVGETDVCDYLDFVVAPGKETLFFEGLLDHLRRQGIRSLDLGPVRADSVTLPALVQSASKDKWTVSQEPEEVTLELDLPASWDLFLGRLTVKQRHEVRRKMRRLDESGTVVFHGVEETDPIEKHVEMFLTLFRSNRLDKAVFMTDQMTAFFTSLTAAMAKAGFLKLFFLKLDGKPAATVLCFDYQKTRYLYNSGYDQGLGSLSVGLLCNIFSIRDAIERGFDRYDFLKGAEAYKFRLGGRPITLDRYRIERL